MTRVLALDTATQACTLALWGAGDVRVRHEIQARAHNRHILSMLHDVLEGRSLREAVDALVTAKGLFSFYEDGHKECCQIRKVEPLRRALEGRAAWITGQRRDQSPGVELMLSVATPQLSADAIQELRCVLPCKTVRG